MKIPRKVGKNKIRLSVSQSGNMFYLFTFTNRTDIGSVDLFDPTHVVCYLTPLHTCD